MSDFSVKQALLLQVKPKVVVRASQESGESKTPAARGGVMSTSNNFLKYSEKDFESYLKYLVNDKHDFYDHKFL